MCVEFTDSAKVKRGYTLVNHPVHLENAARKSRETNAGHPQFFKVTVVGPKSAPTNGHEYLRVVACSFIQFLRGLGASEVELIGF